MSLNEISSKVLGGETLDGLQISKMFLVVVAGLHTWGILVHDVLQKLSSPLGFLAVAWHLNASAQFTDFL